MLICPTREVWWWHITFHKTRKVFPIQRTFNLLSCSWRGVLDTTLCDHVCQWLATGRLFSLGPPASSTNKTVRHDITEILLKVALNTIKQTIMFVNSLQVNVVLHRLWQLCHHGWLLFDFVSFYFLICVIKLEAKNTTLSWTIPKSNIKIVERGKIDTFNAQMHDHSSSWHMLCIPVLEISY